MRRFPKKTVHATLYGIGLKNDGLAHINGLFMDFDENPKAG